jgi:hypothetical protein
MDPHRSTCRPHVAELSGDREGPARVNLSEADP